MTGSVTEDETFPPKITNLQIEEQLERNEITIEIYMPLPCTIFLKRQQEMLYVPLDFENDSSRDAFDDSGTEVRAIAQSDLYRIKQQASANIFKIGDPPNFQIQVANGNLEKAIPTATFIFDNGPYDCRTIRCYEELDRAQHKFALHKTH